MLRKLWALESRRGQTGQFLVVAFAPFLGDANAFGGTIRYELPTLLGQHVYDGDPFYLGRFAFVDTPFGFYSADQARLVVVGTVTSGRAHGDGILREAIDFDLIPSVGATPSFARLINFPGAVTVDSFRIDDIYPNPFHPEITPLPNPDGYPPMSFNVRFGVGPSLSTQYPPAIAPIPGVPFVTTGTIIDVPIMANVTEAYIILEGAQVPEPATWMLVLAGAAIAVMTSRIRLRQ